jgi:hypothetical protein
MAEQFKNLLKFTVIYDSEIGPLPVSFPPILPRLILRIKCSYSSSISVSVIWNVTIIGEVIIQGNKVSPIVTGSPKKS